jgi:hypothetical protein
MRRPGLVKLKAVVLAVVLLKGGGGMPLLDAVLYHRHAANPAAGVRAEAADGQRAHAQLCRLGWTLPDTPDRGTIALGLIVLAPAFRQSPPSLVEPPRSVDAGGLPHPRAPPAPLA